MIPDGVLSTAIAFAPPESAVRQPGDLLLDYELGGRALNDPSAGLSVKVWTVRVVTDAATGDQSVVLSASGVSDTTLFTGVGITEVALAFDQNMNWFVAYMQSGTARFCWYDSTIPGMIVTDLPAGARSPRCCLDERRPDFLSIGDIGLFYMLGGKLCARYQRERYETEHELTTTSLGATATIVSVIRNVGGRLQWRLRDVTSVTDIGMLVTSTPYLSDVVIDLFRRSGVDQSNLDVAQLFTPIEGYRIATQGGANAMTLPLQSAFFFDPGEWDKKIHFVIRGSEPVAQVTFDDLLERDGNDGPLGTEVVQQIELLRKVNVTMVDSTAGWIPNKQTAERRSATIQATGEASDIIPITASPDFIASVALKRLRIPWGEPNKYTYGMGVPWTSLTPTDVIVMTDRKGRMLRMRLTRNEEDYGNFQFESVSDAQWVYESTAAGVQALPSIPTVPGQTGDTIVVVLDVPLLRDQDDELGYYVAACGTEDGWNGGVVQISMDGGATVLQTLSVDVPSVVGSTLTDLLPEASSEYLSSQTLRVTLPEAPESVDRDALTMYRNLAAVQRADGSWEVLQYQTVAPVDDVTFDLSGLVRGRYATEPFAVAAGGTFVLIDPTVTFVQLQQWMLGQTISYRGISNGQDPDDVSWESVVATLPKSQEEWAPVGLTLDGDTVSWIARPRRGVEISPYQSKYFAGYRVTYSDGHTADVTGTSYTRSGVASGVTISVAGLNTITGPGPSSEGIITP